MTYEDAARAWDNMAPDDDEDDDRVCDDCGRRECVCAKIADRESGD